MVYDSYEFGRYLMQLRRRDNISMSVICDGICNVSTMSRIENGEKDVSKIVQDRLLGRLGVAPENFENMIFSDEYERWELRQNIISNIQHENMDEAERLLEYMLESGELIERSKLTEDLDAILELQFYLSMKAQISRYRNADEKELRTLYADALRQTVNGFEARQGYREFFSNRRLSVEEINLLIEYGRYMPEARGITFMRCIVEYIDSLGLEKLAKAKVYPKAVYYLYMLEERKGIDNAKKVKKLLALVTGAIECLRDGFRAFYLYELLDVKMKLLSQSEGFDKEYLNREITIENDDLINETYTENYGNDSSFSITAQYMWCRHVSTVLKDIYSRYGISEKTFEYSYIYADREVYCIEDVIRIRRSMLKMSMLKLSTGICSERTISRIERKLTKPQSAIVHNLFKRLGLSGEFNSSELISSDVEAQKLIDQLRDSINYKEDVKVNDILAQLKQFASMEIPQNRQILYRVSACNLRVMRKISDSEFISEIIRALECTLPYEIAVNSEEKYMTTGEITCMNNIVITKASSVPEFQQSYKILLNMFKSKEKNINNFLSMYEFVMQPIASYQGDCGDFDSSDEIENTIIENTLRNRRITIVQVAMYGMMWNNVQRNKKTTTLPNNDKNAIDELKRCAVLAYLANNKRQFSFYIDTTKKYK